MVSIHQVPLPVTTQIIFTGRVPSKKNAKRMATTKSGRSILLPSKLYEAWHNEHLSALQDLGYKLIPPYRMEVELYPPDLLIADLSNKIESIQDILVDAEILENDDYFKVYSTHPIFVAIDRQNPRFEVTIYSAQERVEYTIPEVEYPKPAKTKKSKKVKTA
jgi:hypothetical protein